MIGVDFDNTIAGYDDLMYAVARERGLISESVPRSKKQIRDAIRALPDGESHWRGLQVTAYGPRMHEARPIDGVKEFLAECRRQGLPIYILSHKTEHANFGDARVNLRDAARAWLDREGFLGAGGLGFDDTSVFFESTREEKIARISALGVTHFIDDLEETFLEAGFPRGVQKLLLCESGPSPDLPDVTGFSGWRQVQRHIFEGPPPAALGSLLGGRVRSIHRCGAGGNSRVNRVTLDDGSCYAVKTYLQPTMDGLDRLEVEFTALSFLWEQGERATPRPAAAAPELRLAAYEFVEGERIDSSGVGAGEIEQAISFIARLKSLGNAGAAVSLPKAAEACGSFEEIHDSIERRLARLVAVHEDGEDSTALADYLALEFSPALDRTVTWARNRMGASGWTDRWPKAGQTLSPSDMGFHNALRKPDGSIVFLDFEYFGHDDVAKMLSDFLLHPAMTLSDAARRLFAGRMLELFASDATLPDRFSIAYPMFALKWCLILLNEFVPGDLARRQFAAEDQIDQGERRKEQLQKSRALLGRMLRELKHFPYGAVRA